MSARNGKASSVAGGAVDDGMIVHPPTLPAAPGLRCKPRYARDARSRRGRPPAVSGRRSRRHGRQPRLRRCRTPASPPTRPEQECPGDEAELDRDRQERQVHAPQMPGSATSSGATAEALNHGAIASSSPTPKRASSRQRTAGCLAGPGHASRRFHQRTRARPRGSATRSGRPSAAMRSGSSRPRRAPAATRRARGRDPTSGARRRKRRR